MSTMGHNNINSLLPADIEEKLSAAQETISNIERKIILINGELETKQNELALVTTQVFDANNDYKNIISRSEIINKELRDREIKLNQRESALNVYASALEEKEKKINKYLSIFDNMKGAIS
jgi:chromosome segregation ATPase